MMQPVFDPSGNTGADSGSPSVTARDAALLCVACPPPGQPGPAAQLVVQSVVAAFALGLEHVTEAAVDVRMPQDDPWEGRGACFLFQLSDARGIRVECVLDERLARALVDSTTELICGLRGTGPLTTAEQGVLELVLLRLVHRLARMDAAGWKVEGMHPAIGMDAGTCREGHRVTLELVFGGQSGLLDLRFSPEEVLAEVPLEDATWRCACHAMNLELRLHLALPPVFVHPAEYEQLVPGSTVSQLRTGLGQLGACNVVTETGWRMCPAKVTAPLPEVVQVQCGPVQPGAVLETPGDRAIRLEPRFGTTRLPLSEIGRLQEGHVLDFHHGGGAVRIYGPDGLAATGRLMTVGQEVVIQIT